MKNKKPSKGDFIKRIEAAKSQIAKARDELREIQDELESVLDSSDRGLEDLAIAVQTLSEYL